MIKQIKYFQAVVRSESFSKAAAECFISQSAISQQIQALEKELSVRLINRERRKITLTEAGELFYRKSLVITGDFDRLCAEVLKISGGRVQELTIGYLRDYHGQYLQKTLLEFQKKHAEVTINLMSGTHEELYDNLRSGKADVVISDMRRKPSEQYVNFFLTKGYFYAQVPEKNVLGQLESLTMAELKNTPIILIAPHSQEAVEELFFREYLGVQSEFIFVETLEQAKLYVAANKGYYPIEFALPPQKMDDFAFIPIFYKGKQVYRKYYAFWRADTLKSYVEEFAQILREQFPAES